MGSRPSADGSGNARTPGRLLSGCKGLLADMRQGRAFAGCLVRARLAARYRHSALGLCWVLAPALASLAFLVSGMRARVVHETVGGIPAPLFVALGVLLVQGLTEGFTVQSDLYAQARVWFQRTPVQIEALVFSGLGEAVFGACLRWMVGLALAAWWGIPPGLGSCVALVDFVGLTIAGSGLGLLIAPWVALSADFRQGARFAPILLFASAPVFWPADSGHGIAMLSRFNPMAPLMTHARALVTSDGTGLSWGSLVLGIASSFLLLVAGWLLVRLFAPAVMERTVT